MLKRGPRNVRRIARAFVNANIGRIGMSLTSHQTEKTPSGRGQIHMENSLD